MRTSSSGGGRIDYLLWDLGLVRGSITQDVDFIMQVGFEARDYEAVTFL